LLSLDLRGPAASADPRPGYDLIFGLDVFEHLNPNRLDAYIVRLAELVGTGGFLFCHIPAFGTDPVFGTVFPLYLDRWGRTRTRAARSRHCTSTTLATRSTVISRGLTQSGGVGASNGRGSSGRPGSNERSTPSTIAT
jgi:hypothetical protein